MDGPASIVFTDGHYIGAVLDRNGLRPSRYYLTHDDRVIMASEVGVLPVALKLSKQRTFATWSHVLDRLPERSLDSGRRTQARVRCAAAIRTMVARTTHHSGRTQAQGRAAHGYYPDSLLERMQAFGFTFETMQFMLLPMIKEARDPIGSMGNDSALACLSDQPRLIYDYFKQLFAQVTNPAIDSIREEVIMSLECYIGPEQNLLDVTPEHCHRLLIPHPILTNEELAALAHMDHRGWKTRRSTSRTIAPWASLAWCQRSIAFVRKRKRPSMLATR